MELQPANSWSLLSMRIALACNKHVTVSLSWGSIVVYVGALKPAPFACVLNSTRACGLRRRRTRAVDFTHGSEESIRVARRWPRPVCRPAGSNISKK